ncbi:MAG: GYD domain-containing protein [Betaproteobacteria bacterium]
MPFYLVQASYTQQSVQAMVKAPQDRAAAIRPAIERMQGKLHGMWFAFGEHDVVAIVELPGNVDAAALSLAIGASGSVHGFRTTALLTMAEATEAMRKAGDTGYQPPR